MKKCFVLVLLSCYHLSFGYDNDRDVKIKTFDSARKYPMKVSYIPNIQQQHGKVMKVKSVSGLNNRKVKREHVDNVKGELIPQSRKDILSIKKLSFHGRDRPVIDESNGHNSSSSQQDTSSYQNHHEPVKATQRNDYYTPRKHNKVQKVYKPEYQSKSGNNVEDIPPYVPDNSPFYPLMKPSPINVMPTEPPSFDTVRNYVHYLKMRQRKFFSDFDNDDEPLPDVKSKHNAATSDEGEIGYFKEREKELAREEELRNQFSPTNYIKNVQSNDDDVERPFTDESNSNESEIITNNGNSQRANDDKAVASDEYNESYGNHYADYADETSREDGEGGESKKTENFVPFRLYAQVRHAEAEHHEKPTKSNIKEKVSLAKKNIYYKEEGYEDKNYDHGSEKVDYDLKEKKAKKPQRQHNKKRSKRSTDGNVDVSQLPVALAYIKKSEIPQLTGEKLFRHLDELIKNSSIYLPDEDDVTRPIRFRPTRASLKYPYYSFPKNVLSEMSAHRYSENIKNYPKHKESLYDYKNRNTKQCEEIEDEIDPVPSDIEEEGKRTKFNESPKRLNNLGSKIQCYREKYFGKDPFDNPLFKEDEYVEATIPIPINHNISRQSNPLITVYDDVINNIRSGILSEFKRKREAEDILKQASEQIAVKAKQVEIPNYSSVAGVSQLSIFDINKFVPKFQGPIHNFSDEDDEFSNESDGTAVNELQKINKKQNRLQLEESQLDPPIQNVKNSISTETPKVKRNNNTKKNNRKHTKIVQVPEYSPKPISSVIKNVQSPIIVKTNLNTNQKFRRFIPQNTFGYPTKQVATYYSQQQQPTQSSGKTTYRFKLL